MKSTLSKILCTLTLLCAVAWSANANLVADPGFEDSTDNIGGNPFSASWTNVDSSLNSGVGGDSLFAHSGTNYAFLGATGTVGSLSQSLATMAGSSYTVSFWLANDQTVGLPQTNSFQVFWNGVSVFSLTNQSPFAYTEFTISGLMATGGATNLEFRYVHDSDDWRLDDVSANAAGVPESLSTIWLALPAFGALGLLHFSRSRARKSLAAI